MYRTVSGRDHYTPIQQMRKLSQVMKHMVQGRVKTQSARSGWTTCLREVNGQKETETVLMLVVGDTETDTDPENHVSDRTCTEFFS